MHRRRRGAVHARYAQRGPDQPGSCGAADPRWGQLRSDSPCVGRARAVGTGQEPAADPARRGGDPVDGHRGCRGRHDHPCHPCHERQPGVLERVQGATYGRLPSGPDHPHHCGRPRRRPEGDRRLARRPRRPRTHQSRTRRPRRPPADPSHEPLVRRVRRHRRVAGGRQGHRGRQRQSGVGRPAVLRAHGHRRPVRVRRWDRRGHGRGRGLRTHRGIAQPGAACDELPEGTGQVLAVPDVGRDRVGGVHLRREHPPASSSPHRTDVRPRHRRGHHSSASPRRGPRSMCWSSASSASRTWATSTSW